MSAINKISVEVFGELSVIVGSLNAYKDEQVSWSNADVKRIKNRINELNDWWEKVNKNWSTE